MARSFTTDHRHIEAGTGVSHIDLRRAEDALGYSLPNDYAQFLTQLGGVTFDHQVRGEYAIACFLDYPLEERPASAMPTPAMITREALWATKASLPSIGVLYGIDEEFFLRSERDPSYHTIFDWIPAHVFPIGWNDSGDFVCIVLDGEDKGSIYYWGRPDVPLSERDQWSELDFLRWVAPNFCSFWDSIALVTYERYLMLEG